MSSRQERSRSRLAVSLAFVVIVLLLLVAAIAGLGYMRISTVRGSLDDAARQTRSYFTALREHPQHADYYLKRAQKALDTADADLAKPPFPQTEWVPGLGQNVVAVRTIVKQLQRMTKDTGPTLSSVATVIDFRTGKPRSHDSAKEWAKALSNSRQTLKDMPDALETFNDAADKIAKVDTAGLLPPIRDSLSGLQGQISQAQENLKVVSRAVNTLGPVLKALP